MNAAIRAATLVALSRGYEVFGISHGYQGLLEDHFVPLTAERVRPILRDGGTILGSARCKSFHDKATRDHAREILTARGIDGLIVIGGNGSLTGALKLTDPAESSEFRTRAVGIPASIDNDIAMTGLCIGVDTAMNTIVDACDKIADTASAHDRTFIVEVMGRDSGYLSMTAAVAAGADVVLFPEANKTRDELVQTVAKTVRIVRSTRDNKKVLCLKAEGVDFDSDELKAEVDRYLAEGQDEHAHAIETRVTVLGHVVRGGRPSAFDRLLASRFGNAAVDALHDGDKRKMIGWLPPTPLPETVATRSPSDPYCFRVDLDAALRATDELIAGKSELARWRAAIFEQLEDVLRG